MIKKIYLFLLLNLFTLIISSGCGGENTGIIPVSNANPNTSPTLSTNQTPTPIVLVNKPVSGIVYINSITVDGENLENVNILNVPANQTDASGNQPLIQQFADNIKQDYPDEWTKQEIQEIYEKLSNTLKESKPLLEYNFQAKIYGAYQESQDPTPLPVNPDGSFNGQVLTDAVDSTANLEVSLNNDESYLDVETITTGDINASDNNLPYELKSCPSKLYALPGEIVIFKIYRPSTNLKESGLSLSLANSDIGYLSPPVYLCEGGQKKYNTACIVFYAKKSIGNTPILSKIIAITKKDLRLEIPVEIVKSTSSVSGHVYTRGETLVKGFVKAYGPKSFSKLDENGNYTLPRIFQAHNVKIIATWWTIDGNRKKVRHREEKIIDFLNGNLNNFDFSVIPTPTVTSIPTSTPTPVPSWVLPSDPYIKLPMSKVKKQFNQWFVEFGEKQAKQMVLKWLNGELNEPPVPENIIKAIDYPDGIYICFSNGMGIAYDTNIEENIDRYIDLLSKKTPTPNQKKFNEVEKQKLQKQNRVNTFRSTHILVLAPIEFHHYEQYFIKNYIKSFQWDIVNYLTSQGYSIDAIRTANSTIRINFPTWDPNNVTLGYKDGNIYLKLINDDLSFNVTDPNNLVRPSNFLKNMKDYGIIFITTHTGSSPFGEGILCCPTDIVDKDITDWMKENKEYHCSYNSDGTVNPKGFWFISTFEYFVYDENLIKSYSYNAIFLLPKAFENQDFRDSLVYLDSCKSWDLGISINQGVKTHLGYNNRVTLKDATEKSYEFFSKLTGINQNTTRPDPNTNPMSIGNAYNSITNNPIANDPQHAKLLLYPDPTQLLETYFPAPMSITVEKKRGEL